jgi:hypothetical protein
VNKIEEPQIVGGATQSKAIMKNPLERRSKGERPTKSARQAEREKERESK